jgi:hypothetical protein
MGLATAHIVPHDINTNPSLSLSHPHPSSSSTSPLLPQTTTADTHTGVRTPYPPSLISSNCRVGQGIVPPTGTGAALGGERLYRLYPVLLEAGAGAGGDIIIIITIGRAARGMRFIRIHIHIHTPRRGINLRNNHNLSRLSIINKTKPRYCTSSLHPHHHPHHPKHTAPPSPPPSIPPLPLPLRRGGETP